MKKHFSILLIEDDRISREIVRHCLAESPIARFSLHTAGRLDTAVELLQHTAVDLILLDLGLPDSGGIASLTAIHSAAPRLPVVVLTGNDDEPLILQAIQAGAEDYLVKGSGAEPMLPRICFYTIERHRAQRQALRSEKILRSTLDSLTAHIAIVDARGTVLSVNRAWRNFARENAGTEPEVCEGANYFDACLAATTEDRQSAERFVEQCRRILAERKGIFDMEYPCHSPTEKRWFHARVTTFSHEDAGVIVVSHEDITPRKLAEEGLRSSERHLRLIINTSPNLVFVKDERSRYVMVNETLASLYGVSPQEMIGRSDLDILERQGLNLAEGEKFLRDDQEVIRTRRRLAIDEEPLTDCRGQRRWFRTIKIPITAPGAPTSVLGIATEITELRKSRETIRNSELRLRTILDALNQEIILIDTGLKVIWANRQACLNRGMGLEELIGSHWPDTASADNAYSACYPATEALRTANLQTGIHRNGDGRTFQVTGCPVTDSAGVITGVVSVAENISERLSLEQQLRQALKMESLGTLAGGIAHDFNNILTAILGFAELGRSRGGDNEAVNNDLQEIYHAGIRARDLVHQILTFSRRIDQERKPLDISPVIKEALKLLRSSLPTTIEINSTVPGRLGLVLADPTQIHQIIMNLCTNAAHAMRVEGGTLRVSLTERLLTHPEATAHPDLHPGHYLELVVSDTGTGIPPAILPLIFDPYFTTKEPGEGTGLGLSVVHGIIREYGGEISAASEPGKGTTFTVLLPSHTDTGNKRAPLRREIPATGRGERILVVDDEPSIVRLCRLMLEKSGYRVETENDSRKALELIRRAPEQIDLLLSDMTMPHMTGEKLGIEALKIKPELPVILMSGNTARLPESLGGASRSIALLAKPVDKHHLTTTIRKLLDRS